MGGIADGGKKKMSKSAFRRAKKREAKSTNASREPTESAAEVTATAPEANGTTHTEKDILSVQREKPNLVEDIVTLDLDDPLYDEFRGVFEKFKEPTDEELARQGANKAEIYFDDDLIPDEEEEEEAMKAISKKKKKEMNKLSIAELKAMVKKPELVEWTDISSSDPVLLLNIKSQKNIIPVPTHWSLKREYLSSKRGIEKPPFKLPKFIAETGISEMRDALLEKQAEQTLKQKQRERVQGKIGKLDIDYQKLYEAFFRRQTKPELTRYGEVYYEGKEYETNLKHLRPGELSDELKEALSMPPGAPPPWLINQQRYGLPPSYPNLKIPGLNCPPPVGASWGFGPGQYGKPPMDDLGRPLWGGDPIGQAVPEQLIQPTQFGEPIERGPWGELRAEGESEDEVSEDEEEEEEDEDEDEDVSGVQTSFTGVSTALPSEFGGAESIAGEFTLRKQRKGMETEEPAQPRSAYQVLPEQNIRAQGFFGGEKAYDLKTAKQDMLGEDRPSNKRKAGDIEVSVDVDALARDDKLNKDELRKVYEAQKKAEAQGNWSAIDLDDLSDMIAQEARKRVKRDDDRRGRR